MALDPGARDRLCLFRQPRIGDLQWLSHLIRAAARRRIGRADNCFQNGLLPVVLPAAGVKRLADRTGQGEALTIDLVSCSIAISESEETGFEIDAMRQQTLLEGLDDISRTLQQAAEIADWQLKDRAARPWIWGSRRLVD